MSRDRKALSGVAAHCSLFQINIIFLQDSVLQLYLIITNAIPAAGLIRQSLQVLDAKLQSEQEASDK